MKALKLLSHHTGARGNALMEYAVPAAVILLSAGVLASVTDATDIMADYFLAASGHTRTSLTGQKFQTTGLGENSYGIITSSGLSGFSSFVRVLNGNRVVSERVGGGTFYFGVPPLRTGPRPEPISNEYLFR